MKKTLILLAILVLVLSACGSSDSDDSTTQPAASGAGGSDGATNGGDVVDPQPPGQATASVDGQDFTFTEPGAVDCNIEPDTITFSFRIGDNEVTLGGGANLYDTGWLGSIDLRVANPASGDGPVSYYPDLAENGSGLVISGASLSYSGPMLMQPPNDGSLPPPEDVGDGTFSVTCP